MFVYVYIVFVGTDFWRDLDYEVENQSVTADACRDLEHECVSSFRNTNKNKYQSVLHVMFLKKKLFVVSHI
jgi:hypothetical protein